MLLKVSTLFYICTYCDFYCQYNIADRGGEQKSTAGRVFRNKFEICIVRAMYSNSNGYWLEYTRHKLTVQLWNVKENGENY